VPSALRLIGPPQNPNVVKGYVRSLAQLNPGPLIDLAVRSYILFLKPFGSQFVEPFLNGFETIAESLGLSEVNSSARVDEHQHYIDKDKNRDPNQHHNSDTAGEVTSERVHQFAAEAGWPAVPEARLQAWLAMMPNLCWDEFVSWGNEIRTRDEVNDPLPYLFGLLSKRKTLSKMPLPPDEHLGLVPDGTEITFDD